MWSLIRFLRLRIRANCRKLLLTLLLVDVVFMVRFAYDFADNQQRKENGSSSSIEEKPSLSPKDGDKRLKEEVKTIPLGDVRTKQRGLSNRIMIQAQMTSQYDDVIDVAAERSVRIEKNFAQLPVWQKLHKHPEIYVYKAFYDNRRNEPSIVTLALIHKDVTKNGIPSVSCYFPVKSTLSAQKGTLATLQEVPGNRYQEGYEFGSWVFICNIPYIEGIKEDSHLPETMTMDAGSLLGSVILPVRVPTRPAATLTEADLSREQEQPVTFGSCLAPLHGDVKAEQLAQMFEMSKILGVQNAILHVQSLSPDLMLAQSVDKMLQVYDDEGFLEELPWSLPVDENKIFQGGQALAFLDCLYTGLFHYSYVLMTSVREVLMPQDFTQIDALFFELLDTAPNRTSGFCFFGAVFSDPSSASAAGSRRQNGKGVAVADVVTRTDVLRDRVRCALDTRRISLVDSLGSEGFPISDSFLRPQRVSPDIALNHIYTQCDKSEFGEACDQRLRFDRSSVRLRTEFMVGYRKALSSMQAMLQQTGT